MVDYSLQPSSSKSKASGHLKLKLCFHGSQAETINDKGVLTTRAYTAVVGAPEEGKTLENCEDEIGEGYWSMIMQFLIFFC